MSLLLRLRSSVIPPVPVETETTGGFYERRSRRVESKPRKKPDADVREWIEAAYAEMQGSRSDSAQAIAPRIVQAVRDYETPAARTTAAIVPPASVIDWDALAADVAAVQQIVAAYFAYLHAMEDEDDEDLLLMVM